MAIATRRCRAKQGMPLLSCAFQDGSTLMHTAAKLQQKSTCCSSLECKCQEAHHQDKCQSSLHEKS